MNSITTPWLAELVLISWRTFRQQSRPPLPSELLASFIIFGTAGVVTQKAPQVGAVFGWGIVVATALNLFGAADKLTGNTQNNPAYAKTNGQVANNDVVGPVAKRTSP